MVIKWIQWVLLSVMLMVAAVGCGGTSPAEKPGPSGNTTTKPTNTEPVTLTLYPMYSGGDDFVQKVIVDPVTKKFPNVSFNVIKYGEPNQEKVFQGFLAGGTVPDIMMVNFGTVRVLKELQIAVDLSEMIKKNKVDTSNFTPQAIKAMLTYGDGKALLALPYYLNLQTLMYNKDIFDKFGVPYPKDGMTWKQATELSKSLARTENGVQYLGLQPGRPHGISTQLGLDYLDPKTGKINVNTDGWKQVFNMLKGIYSIEGNLPKDTSLFNDSYKAMIVNRVQAMGSVWWNGIIPRVQKVLDSNAEFNWDIVTEPTFEQAPHVAPYLNQFAWSISAQSKHQDLAFDIIHYLTSHDMQIELAKSGQIPSLNDKSVQSRLGENIPWLKGKNLQALFKDQYTLPMTPITQIPAGTMMNKTYADIMYRNVDVNTALRQLDEAMNSAMQEAK
ncbi:MAG: extracellular solute-binding protein family 1 [Paenibacillaceae bacterium]|nr:extracellular solute-binding protein family 1 [Paenibacillaceae bacterium]